MRTKFFFCVMNASARGIFFIFDFFDADACFSRTFCIFLFIFDSAVQVEYIIILLKCFDCVALHARSAS